MRVAKAKFPHLMHILDHLSEQNQGELDAAGLTKWGALRLFQKYLAEGEAEVAFLDETPACILGLVGEPKRTWFVATPEFFGLGGAGVIFCRRYLKRNSRRFGPLITSSMAPHPDAERWFTLLGYVKIHEADGTKLYRYG